MSSLPSSGSSAGGRRFWTTVLFFALANVTVWFVYHNWYAALQPRRDILAMQRFTENIGDPTPHAKPALLSWTFNLDMARPGPIKPNLQGQLPGTFSPPIAGDWLWSDARTLTFKPADSLPRATKFTATLTPALLSTPEGYTLPAPVTSTFSTASLQLLSVKQAGFDDNSRMLLELSFNDKVLPREVLSHLELADNTGTVKATLNGDVISTTVRILTDPLQFKDASKDKTLFLDLSPGLAGASGPLGIDKPVHWEIPVSSILAADKLEASVPSDGDPELTLTFNNVITDQTIETLKPLISVDPQLSFTLRKDYNNSLLLDGPFQPATRYTVTIAKPPIVNPHTLLRPAALSIFIPDRDPAAFFENTNGYLGSKGNRTLLVKAVNVPAVRVTVSRVYENNLVAWQNAHTKSWMPDNADRYAHPIATRRFLLPIRKNKLQDLRINLDDLLTKGQATDGTYKIDLALDNSPTESPDDDSYRSDYSSDDNTSALVTLSDIGLTAKLMADPATTGHEQSLLVWAVSLSTGKPLANIHLRIYSNKNQLLGEAISDNDGLARIDHLNPAENESPAILIAESTDSALTWLDLSKAARNDRVTTSEGRPYLRNGYEAFVWSERGVYRPGESVMLRAIVRGKDMSVPPADLPLRFQIRRPDGRDWLSQTVRLDADGGAEWKLTFPSDAQTGYWSAELGLPGDAKGGSTGMQSYGSTDFQIEDFIPDRIKVAIALSNLPATVADKKSRVPVSAKPLLVEMQSDYLFGQPAANLSAQLTTVITPAVFTTKNFPASDGWIAGDTADAASALADNKRPTYAHLQATPQTLDQNGHTQFSVDLEKSLTPADDSLYSFRGPWHLTLIGTTLETGGRPVTAYASTEADGLPSYLMSRPIGPTQTGYIAINSTAAYDLRLVTPNGKLATGAASNLKATVFKEEWETNLTRNQGRYEYQSTRTLTPVKEATDIPVTLDAGFKWKASDVGSFVIQFADNTTHQITTTRLYVGEEANDGGWNDNISKQDPEALDVQIYPAEVALADVKNAPAPSIFRASQSVKAIIRAPFPGKLLLTVETDTILLTKVIDMPSTVGEITFELPPEGRPTAYIAATVIRPINPNDKEWLTHRAFGNTRITIDPADRKLNIAIAAAKEIRPSTNLDIQLAVTDPQGKPVKNAAIALAAVDEGILRLTAYATPSPLQFFNSPRALGITSADLYSQLMPEVANLEGQSPTGGDGEKDDFGHRHSSPIAAKRIRPVSLLSEILHTDDNGKITAHLQVPEFLGQLRIMAVSYAGPLTGSADQSVLVRSPLVVQSSFPRFLAPGDSCNVPLLLINNSKSPGDAHIKLSADGPLNFDRNTATVALNPGEQKTLNFTLTANSSAGIGHIALEAVLSDSTFTEHTNLPVRPASPTISRGNYATATTDKPLNLAISNDMLPGTETFQLRIGERPTLSIPSGLDYLDHYPYGCLEQTTSECLPLVYLHDIGSQIAPNVFNQEIMDRKIQTGINRLMAMQTADGGLSMWAGENSDWEWGSVYAAHFLVEAEHAGYGVPSDFKSHLFAYLRSLLAKSAEAGAGTELQSYALYVLALDGRPDRAAMNRLGEVLEEFNLNPAPPEGIAEARFNLALAWAASGRKDLAEKLLPDTIPSLRTTRNLAGNIGSPIRDQALLILTLLTINPNHPQLPALIERLSLAGEQHGWESTQDNAFAIMALGKYLRSIKDEKPFESAQLLAAEKILASADGKSPLLFSGPPGQYTIKISGPAGATAFVSWLQTGVPLIPPVNTDHALKIRRSYQTEDGIPLANEIATGTAIKVQIIINSPTALDNLVIEDLLPAGLEIENPRLATAKKEEDTSSTITPSRLDPRDDRFIVVTSVPAGSSTYTYLARAVTPGSYTVPPIRGECMYDPSINSLNGASHLTIATTTKALAQQNVAQPPSAVINVMASKAITLMPQLALPKKLK